MTNKTVRMVLIAFFSLPVIFSIDASAQSYKKIDCARASDKDVILAIYDSIKAKYPPAPDFDMRQRINVSFKDGVATLDGRVVNEKIKRDIEKIVKKIKCVKRPIVNNLEIGLGVGCGKGQKECGDICIRESEPCNVCLLGGPCE